MSNFKIVKLIDPIQLNLAGGLNFQGDYDNATAYVVGDVVTYNGSSYAALQNTTGNLPTDTNNWQLLAEKGDPLTVNAGENIDIDVISPTEITINTVEDDDAALTANSATVIPSQKAVKAYADTKLAKATNVTSVNDTGIADGEIVVFNLTNKDIRTSDKTIVTTIGSDDTTVPTSKAVKDATVASNIAITGATKTKITYDAKGLVTAGADAGTSDITGLDTALDGKVAKAGDTMTGNLNMGTNNLIGGTGVTSVLKLQGTTANGTANAQAINLLVGNNGATTALSVLNNGTVGIGTTTPLAPLHINSSGTTNETLPGVVFSTPSTTNQFRLQNYINGVTYLSQNYYRTAPSGPWVKQNSSNKIAAILINTVSSNAGIWFATGDAVNNVENLTRMLIDTNGRVGIGTGVGTLSSTLQVHSLNSTTVTQIIRGAASQTADLLQIQNSAGGVLSTIKGDGTIIFGGSTTGSSLCEVSIVNINKTGQVGLSVYASLYSSSFPANVEILDSAPTAINVGGGFVFGGNDGTTARRWWAGIRGGKETAVSGNYAGYLSLFTRQDGSGNNTERMRISSQGYVGIATTNPQEMLSVVGSVRYAMLLDNSTSSGGTNTWRITPTGSAWGAGDKKLIFVYNSSTSTNSMFTLDGTNTRIGINNTAPTERLDVTGTIRATGYKSSDGSAGVSGTFTTTDGKTITIKDGLVTSIV